MRVILPFMLVLTTLLFSGCTVDPVAISSEKQAIAQVAAPFAQGTITLEIQTAPDLNALHNIANSCTLLIIQAQKASTLNKLLSNPFALKKLFSAAGAQDDILKVDRYPAMPGQSITLHIDRSDNTRYVAIVAGYYPFPQKQHMRLVAIPVTTESNGWWNKTWSAELAPISMKLRLGSNSISQFEGGTEEPLVFITSDAIPAAAGKGD